jgi:hypothetical protein
MARHPRSTRLIGLGLVTLFLGCTPRLIPGTNIEDTKDSRAILRVMEQFREALEARDSDALISLVSPNFKDKGGTPSLEDDLDYASLQKKLPERFSRLQDVHVDIDVRSMSINPKLNFATAIYYYTTRFRMPGLSQKPHDESDLKEMALQREGGVWKIVSGI